MLCLANNIENNCSKKVLYLSFRDILMERSYIKKHVIIMD